MSEDSRFETGWEDAWELEAIEEKRRAAFEERLAADPVLRAEHEAAVERNKQERDAYLFKQAKAEAVAVARGRTPKRKKPLSKKQAEVVASVNHRVYAEKKVSDLSDHDAVLSVAAEENLRILLESFDSDLT